MASSSSHPHDAPPTTKQAESSQQAAQYAADTSQASPTTAEANQDIATTLDADVNPAQVMANVRSMKSLLVSVKKINKERERLQSDNKSLNIKLEAASTAARLAADREMALCNKEETARLQCDLLTTQVSTLRMEKECERNLYVENLAKKDKEMETYQRDAVATINKLASVTTLSKHQAITIQHYKDTTKDRAETKKEMAALRKEIRAEKDISSKTNASMRLLRTELSGLQDSLKTRDAEFNVEKNLSAKAKDDLKLLQGEIISLKETLKARDEDIAQLREGLIPTDLSTQLEADLRELEIEELKSSLLRLKEECEEERRLRIITERERDEARSTTIPDMPLAQSESISSMPLPTTTPALTPAESARARRALEQMYDLQNTFMSTMNDLRWLGPKLSLSSPAPSIPVSSSATPHLTTKVNGTALSMAQKQSSTITIPSDDFEVEAAEEVRIERFSPEPIVEPTPAPAPISKRKRRSSLQPQPSNNPGTINDASLSILLDHPLLPAEDMEGMTGEEMTRHIIAHPQLPFFKSPSLLELHAIAHGKTLPETHKRIEIVSPKRRKRNPPRSSFIASTTTSATAPANTSPTFGALGIPAVGVEDMTTAIHTMLTKVNDDIGSLQGSVLSLSDALRTKEGVPAFVEGYKKAVLSFKTAAFQADEHLSITPPRPFVFWEGSNIPPISIPTFLPRSERNAVLFLWAVHTYFPEIDVIGPVLQDMSTYITKLGIAPLKFTSCARYCRLYATLCRITGLLPTLRSLIHDIFVSQEMGDPLLTYIETIAKAWPEALSALPPSSADSSPRSPGYTHLLSAYQCAIVSLVEAMTAEEEEDEGEGAVKLSEKERQKEREKRKKANFNIERQYKALVRHCAWPERVDAPFVDNLYPKLEIIADASDGDDVEKQYCVKAKDILQELWEQSPDYAMAAGAKAGVGLLDTNDDSGTDLPDSDTDSDTDSEAEAPKSEG